MTITVRPLEARDHDEWLRLWNDYCDFYEVNMPHAVTISSWHRMLSDTDPNVFGLVAEHDGAVVGITHCIIHQTTWSIEPRCYLNDLFVDPTARGLGVGRALIEEVQDLAAQNHWNKVHWLTHESNDTARRLYDSMCEAPSGFIQYALDPKHTP